MWGVGNGFETLHQGFEGCGARALRCKRSPVDAREGAGEGGGEKEGGLGAGREGVTEIAPGFVQVQAFLDSVSLRSEPLARLLSPIPKP